MSQRTGSRVDLIAGAASLVLVALAAVVGVNTPSLFAGAPPLFAVLLPHVGPGTPLALAVAAAVVFWGPGLAARLGWRPALALTYLTAVAWTFALALVDGWQRGVADRLARKDEYLHEVGGITDIGAMLRGFSARILDFKPDSWTTHVAGHPPGATLVFVWLDRLGLGGGAWAAMLCVLVGALTAVAVPGTIRALGSDSLARSALPFLALLPGAVWVGVSADGLFAGVTAVGIALLARRHWAAWLGGGVLLGFGIFLSYGLVLLGLVALGVVLATRRWLSLALAVLGALAVVAAFAAAGFWWLDGYHLVVERYYQGIASVRPYGYWVWANFAALALAAGPATAAGLTRLNRSAKPLLLLTGAALLAVLAADLTGLSKAEVERIWLPFTVWLVPAAALLPGPARRWWLAAQALTALAVNHVLLTNW
ncbi:hypothetical protein [Kutzneria albida]|uniref:hypothetical protein n=1 Tax=Kutzneria albida TaxID=43357 RepID=UPI001F2CABA5|nr:hypothetical protein [Kutzneria albida]